MPTAVNGDERLSVATPMEGFFEAVAIPSGSMAVGPLVRRLRPDDWSSFRRLRLEALKTDPLAFGSTYAREISYPETQWKSWAGQGAEGPTTPTFVVDTGQGTLVGMAGLFRRDTEFVVWGMWVAPSVRRRKLGGQLMEALLDWVDTAFPGARISLEVNPSLTPAVRTYVTHGFVFTGKEKPLGHDSPGIVREMVRRRQGGTVDRE